MVFYSYNKILYCFTELLVDALFKPGVKINPEHKSKYIYLLAYAASVCETAPKKSNTRKINKDELKTTIQAIEKVHNICNINKGSTELIAELHTLYQSIRYNIDFWYFSLSRKKKHSLLIDLFITDFPL